MHNGHGSTTVIMQRGLPERYRAHAARLYDEAFGPKFRVAIRSDQRRLALLETCIMPEHAIIAIVEDELAGIAGFHTGDGSFTSGMLSGGLSQHYLISRLGYVPGIWASWILRMYQRTPLPGELLMDGIAVRSDKRGKGIGGGLLDEITAYAREYGYTQIRLHVIDTNPRARALYEKKGFKAVGSGQFRHWGWLLGFNSATAMVLDVRQ